MSIAIRQQRLVAVVVLGLALGAGALYASHASGYHWARTSNPFTLKLGDNVSSTWDPHLAVAASDWSASSVLDTVVVAGGTQAKTCRPTGGRVELCSAGYGNTGWLGLTQIWVTGGVHVTQATTKLNDTYFKSPPYNTAAWRQHVICREIGRTLGLNASNLFPGSCMAYTDDPAANQHPNQHDYDELEAIYAHLDSFGTVGASVAPGSMPPAMREIDFAGLDQWGRVVRISPNGRTSVHELDFGRGNKILTVVLWAMPEDFAGPHPDRPEM